MQDAAEQMNQISAWIDRSLADKPAEAILWHRVGKVGEEHGEAIEALIGATNGNPRKPHSHTLGDVRKELLDTALAALCAWAHLADNEGDPVEALVGHTVAIHARAGLGPAPTHRYAPRSSADGMVYPRCSCGWGWGGCTLSHIAQSVWADHVRGER